MLRETFIAVLKKSLQRYLALDPETLKRLADLSGKVVKLKITEFDQALYLFPSATGIDIKTVYKEKTDAEITGSLFDLVKIRLADKKTVTALTKKLTIKGDVHLAQTLNQILQQIDIDWEEPLSQFTGDIIAHQIGSLARSFKQWRKQTTSSLQQNMTEYLQEEIRELPSREEVEDFFVDIKKLQHDVERLGKKHV